MATKTQRHTPISVYLAQASVGSADLGQAWLGLADLGCIHPRLCGQSRVVWAALNILAGFAYLSGVGGLSADLGWPFSRCWTDSALLRKSRPPAG